MSRRVGSASAARTRESWSSATDAASPSGPIHLGNLREFITWLGCATAVAWPFSARAQQPGKAWAIDIVETLRGSRSRAVLMASHGPFTVGKDGTAAVKAAVMVEEVARTVHVACQLGQPVPIAQADIDSLYDRYQNDYGQP